MLKRTITVVVEDEDGHKVWSELTPELIEELRETIGCEQECQVLSFVRIAEGQVEREKQRRETGVDPLSTEAEVASA